MGKALFIPAVSNTLATSHMWLVGIYFVAQPAAAPQTAPLKVVQQLYFLALYVYLNRGLVIQPHFNSHLSVRIKLGVAIQASQ